MIHILQNHLLCYVGVWVFRR